MVRVICNRPLKFCVLCTWTLCLFVTRANAAKVTDVADAADRIRIGSVEQYDPFDLYVDTQFQMHILTGRITREPFARGDVRPTACLDASHTDCLEVDELQWKQVVNQLDVTTQVGVFRDLALTLGVHYFFGDTTTYKYAKGVSFKESSVDPASSNTNENLVDIFGAGANGLQTKRQGWGNFDLGVRYAPLNDERDASKPSWVLSLTWAAPWMSKTYNPKNAATNQSPGTIGDGVHRLTFGTAFSKRMGHFGAVDLDPRVHRRGYMDPYMEFTYMLPIPEKGRALRDHSASKTAFGKAPSHVVQMNGGVEVVLAEDLMAGRALAIDLGLRTAYVSEGRNLSELSIPLGELTATEQYFHVGGLVGLYFQAADFLRFRAGVGLGYNSEHFITFEESGRDKDGDKKVSQDGADVLNPYFCGNSADDNCHEDGGNYPYPYDQVGMRFKSERTLVFNWFGSMEMTF